jgi:hypothetical protein
VRVEIAELRDAVTLTGRRVVVVIGPVVASLVMLAAAPASAQNHSDHVHSGDPKTDLQELSSIDSRAENG